jgi:hypothetical protein
VTIEAAGLINEKIRIERVFFLVKFVWGVNIQTVDMVARAHPCARDIPYFL